MASLGDSPPVTAELSHDDEVFVRLYPRLRKLAAVVAVDAGSVDDLVQEALARTLARHRLADLDDPEAYLRLVVVRLAANERRRLGRARRATARLDASERSDAGEHAPAGASGPLLDQLLGMPPLDRAILYLTVVEGATVADAARQLGRSEPSVRMRRHRALRRLRAYVKEDGNG